MAFHANDGWHFERADHGAVVLTKRVPVLDQRAAPFGQAVVERVAFTADTWASIVASVSREGETSTTWRRARAGHDGVTDSRAS